MSTNEPAPLTPEELSAELVRLGGWLGMDELVVERRGDLAPSIRRLLGA